MIKSSGVRGRKHVRGQRDLFPSAADSDALSGAVPENCQVVAVGKRRDGGTRYWCLRHKADATAKYGRPAATCRASHIPPIAAEDTLALDMDKYKGGIALWGAVPPVYDTTLQPMDRGVHVHARTGANGVKEMDRTARAVRLFSSRPPREGVFVSEIDAIYYMITSIFGYGMKNVTCSHCGHAHLDRDWFSVHPHRRHLCAGCGRHFWDTETAIGNPICAVRDAFGMKAQAPRPSKKKLTVRQPDFPGGIRIWGSNPGFLWTSQRPEEEGIHVHAFGESGELPEVDETYSRVSIDGASLDPAMVRILMAQAVLPSLRNRVLPVNCPSCGDAQFGTGELAFTPIAAHSCKRCGHQFAAAGRLRKTIANPLPGILARLAEKAPRQPHRHDLNLMPETL